MPVFLIIVIYVAYTAIGMHGSILGASWPVMSETLIAPLSLVGALTMSVKAGTVVSGLFSEKLLRRCGAGVMMSVGMLSLGLSLLGYSFSAAVWQVFLWCIPLGLAAGTIDAALNNYVALNYSARHISWLHCFYAVGASVSPYIMAHYIAKDGDWQSGARLVSFAIIGVAVLVFFTLPIWKDSRPTLEKRQKAAPLAQTLKIKGVKYALLAFFCYCSAETTVGAWASSYLVDSRGVDEGAAARYASLFYIGIMVGRFLAGFAAERLGDRRIIRLGAGGMLLGVALIFMPVKELCLAGLVMIGLGCAPIYPAIIHSTPSNFGKENAQAVIGIQLASAYSGSTLAPPLFGLIAQRLGVGLYPPYLLLFSLLTLLFTERLFFVLQKKKQAE
jgi:fucose permease